MNNRIKTLTWDSVVTLIICAVIAVVAIVAGTSWLGKSEYLSEPVVREAVSQGDSDNTDLPDVLPPEITETDAQPSDAPTDDTVYPSKEDVRKQYVVVTVKSAVIRSSNSADSDMVAYVSKGKKLEVVDKIGKWYSVMYMGKVRWIHQKCVEPCEE